MLHPEHILVYLGVTLLLCNTVNATSIISHSQLKVYFGYDNDIVPLREDLQ